MKQEKEQTTNHETEELKRRQRRKSLLFYPAIGLLFAGVIYLIFSPSSEKDRESGETVLGYKADIPLPVEAELFDDKKSAYELASIGQFTEEKRKNLEDYAAALEQQPTDSVSIVGSKTDHEPVENSIRQSGNAYRNIHRELHSFYTPRDTEKEALKNRWRN